MGANEECLCNLPYLLRKYDREKIVRNLKDTNFCKADFIGDNIVGNNEP